MSVVKINRLMLGRCLAIIWSFYHLQYFCLAGGRGFNRIQCDWFFYSLICNCLFVFSLYAYVIWIALNLKLLQKFFNVEIAHWRAVWEGIGDLSKVIISKCYCWNWSTAFNLILICTFHSTTSGSYKMWSC